MTQARDTAQPDDAAQGKGGVPVAKLKLLRLIAADRTVTLAGGLRSNSLFPSS